MCPTMEKSPETLTEQRTESMVSPNGSDPILRTAHFLKPTITAPLPNLPSPFATPNSQKPPLQVSFMGWCSPQRKWDQWVDHMASLHGPTWKKAGCFEAIMSSKYRIRRDYDLLSGFAQKWCMETKSFVFSWGEVSVTLEDVLVLGGYSVVGDPVFSPLLDRESEEIEEKLKEARLEIVRTSAKKASQCGWKTKFMLSGSELEHEAFLVLWLSRFVFPFVHDTICELLFSTAILIAKGTRIALGPAILASIYRDLSFWKEKIVALNELDTSIEVEDGVLELSLWSPLQLLQVWVWERFSEFRPSPNLIQCGEPRLARWDSLRCLEVENVESALDSGGESFLWRPYARNVENLRSPEFYVEKDVWVSVDADLDVELESFARFLRVSELVGVDCVQQYLPHRVAMQFGMDQDLPGFVAQSHETPEVSWERYCEPISDVKFYIPSRHFEADVTTRYLEWWKQSVSCWPNKTETVVMCNKSYKKLSKSSENKKSRNKCGTLKCDGLKANHSTREDDLPLAAWLKSGKKCDRQKRSGNSLDEDDLPIAALLRPRKKSDGRKNRRDASTNKDELPIAKLLKLSRACDDGADGNVESEINPGETAMPCGVESGESQSAMKDAAGTDSEILVANLAAQSDDVIISSGAASNNGNENNIGNDPIDNSDGINGNDEDIMWIQFEMLESRTSRLESMMAKIKEARIHQKFEKEAAAKEGTTSV